MLNYLGRNRKDAITNIAAFLFFMGAIAEIGIKAKWFPGTWEPSVIAISSIAGLITSYCTGKPNSL